MTWQSAWIATFPRPIIIRTSCVRVEWLLLTTGIGKGHSITPPPHPHPPVTHGESQSHG